MHDRRIQQLDDLRTITAALNDVTDWPALERAVDQAIVTGHLDVRVTDEFTIRSLPKVSIHKLNEMVLAARTSRVQKLVAKRYVGVILTGLQVGLASAPEIEVGQHGVTIEMAVNVSARVHQRQLSEAQRMVMARA